MSRRIACSAIIMTTIVVITVTGGGSTAAADDASGQGSSPLRRVLAAYKRGESQDQRIVGGHNTTIDKHPWQVALLVAAVPVNGKAQFCGGSIVGSRWVVTAAHCVDNGTQAEQVAVLTGTASLSNGGRRIAVDRILVHDKWNATTHDFDIALVHVATDLGGRAIKGLGTSEQDPQEHQEIVVTGWGALAWRDSAGTKDLQEVSVPYVARSTCNKKASYDSQITENMLCAGKDEGGADSCQGDSGGPASVVKESDQKLVGIVSWGEGCGFPKKFGVYTRVSQFATWVTEKTAGDVQW